MYANRKANVHFLLDSVSLFVLAALVATGLIMEYRLPPGTGGREEGPAWAILGLTRHDWGTIHYVLAIVFLGLMIAHLLLHWRWVWNRATGAPRAFSAGRALGLVIGLLMACALMAAPFLPAVEKPAGSRAEGVSPNALLERRDSTAGSRGPSTEHTTEPTIRGSMSLQEVADTLGLTIEQVRERLGLPSRVEPTDRLGRTVQAHGMSVSQARQRLGNRKPAGDF